MNASQYKKGMMVRVAESIPLTKKHYTANDQMYEMTGKIFKIDHLNQSRNGGYIIYDCYRYVFRLEELHILTESKPIPPVMFDPKSL